jgi:lipid-A-disaccharide synthase
MPPQPSPLTPHRSGPKVLIVTGEASGDLHGARLIKATSELTGAVSFIGVGGQRMADAGCEIFIPSEELSVMGLVEVLGHFPVIWRAFQRLKKMLQGAQRPDALVLIDFPEFNLRLAKQARRAGIPVLYYVSPQVWAWRRGRVKKIARLVDRLAAILPFEPELYRGLDIRVEYVGHPLLDEFSAASRHAPPTVLAGLPPGTPLIGLFPGSRRSELKYMLATLVEAAERIRQLKPEVHFVVPVAAGLPREAVTEPFAAQSSITFIDSGREDIYGIIGACDAIVSVSGTVTLQIALAGTPLAIFYKVAPLTYAIGRWLVRLDHIGLTNIVAGKQVAREFIQAEATAENLAAEAVRLIEDKDYARSVRQGLAEVRLKLGEPGCSSRVAHMLLEMIGFQPQEN